MRDVNISVTDGGIGSVVNVGDGIHIKIGASPIVTSGYITITGSMDYKKIRELLGNCPLADAAMDSVSSGSNLIYCYPVNPTTPGTIGEVTSTKTGTGTMEASGTPNNAFAVVVEILKEGGLNAATFKYSINNGTTFSNELTVPLGGAYVIPDTGITITFTAPLEQTFASGDKFTFKTTAPAISTQGILDALAKIKVANIDFELVHIVGPGNKALWTSLGVEANNFFNTVKRPLFFISETRNMADTDLSLDAYVQALLTEREGIANYLIQVVSARVEFTRMDGTVNDINFASVACGLYSRARVSQSIGEVQSFAIQGITKLLPEGIENHIDTLDAAKFLTVRQYSGIEGYYVNQARMMAPDGSDYQYAEYVRTMIKLVKQVRIAALSELQKEIDLSDQETSLTVIAEIVSTPLDIAAKDTKEISSGRIIIPEGQDILATETINLTIKFIPKGISREFKIDIGIENPNA